METYVITDSGFGDAGKGTIVHWLTKKKQAHTVIRTGAAQALHTVVTENGIVHTHSQFGSGTLAGAKTHLSRYMVLDPYKIIREGQALEKLGIANVFEGLTIDEEALVITPWHIMANRLKEISRGDHPFGSVGRGVGEAVTDSQALNNDLTIRAKDFFKPWLSQKMATIREFKLSQLAPVIENIKSLPESYQTKAKKYIDQLQDPQIVDWATSEFNHMASLALVVDSSYLGEILRQPGVVIFEPSQGVLLDSRYGFHPHTTRAIPTPDVVMEMLLTNDYQGEIIKFALTRGVSTRHGNGPFVTEDNSLSQKMIDENNPHNEWQGTFRVGQLDLLALRYAIKVCGGPRFFNGLAVTCLDQMKNLPVWQICNQYHYVGNKNKDVLKQFFVMNRYKIIDIIIRPDTKDDAQLDRQQKLGELLRECRPLLTEIAPNQYLKEIERYTGIPVKIVSYGPTEKDKSFI